MITKLPDEWLEKYTCNRGPGRCVEKWDAGKERAAEEMSRELRDALPKWTKITDDPDTWPGDYGNVVLKGDIDNIYSVKMSRDTLLAGGRRGRWWRPLCDLDYPPEE